MRREIYILYFMLLQSTFENNCFSSGDNCKRFCFSRNLSAFISQFQRLHIWALCNFVGPEDHRPPRRAFLEPPETFRAYFGCHNILKTKTFRGVKFCNKFFLSFLEIKVKDQLFRISGSLF